MDFSDWENHIELFDALLGPDQAKNRETRFDYNVGRDSRPFLLKVGREFIQVSIATRNSNFNPVKFPWFYYSDDDRSNWFMTKLTLGGLGLSYVNYEVMDHLDQLEELDLRGNNLTTFELTKVKPKLHHLNLSTNNLEVIDCQFDELFPKLQVLYFQQNHLKQFDFDSIAKNIEIERINLSDNEISQLDLSKLSGLSYLQQVDISSNNLTEFTCEIHLPKLSTLNIGNNSLREFNIQGYLPSLSYLGLYENRIKKLNLPDLSESCPNIRKLYAWGNNLQQLNFDNLAFNELRELNISGNMISQVNGLDQLNHAELLDLSFNQLTSFDLGLIPDGLEKLYLQFNPLTEIELSNISSTDIKLVNLTDTLIDEINLDYDDKLTHENGQTSYYKGEIEILLDSNCHVIVS